MKTSHAAALIVASVLITVAVEENRISSLRAKVESTSKSSAPSDSTTMPAVARTDASSAPSPVRTKSLERPETAKAEVKPADTSPADDELTTSARRMWDNPAGKSMMNQGVKMVVGMMYQDFIDGMGLSKEEADYFKNLLGKEISGQQEFGMKLMGASPEERTALMEEHQKLIEQNEEDIKRFLNNDEDFKNYTDYKNHLPERQQLDGIRAVMNDKGVPLDEKLEERLVDAMYKVRTSSGAPDLSGAKGMEALSQGNITETFEKSWAGQQEALNKEVAGFLSPEQATAFADYQKQMKEMQLMGLKMAEKMFPKSKEGEKK